MLSKFQKDQVKDKVKVKEVQKETKIGPKRTQTDILELMEEYKNLSNRLNYINDQIMISTKEQVSIDGNYVSINKHSLIISDVQSGKSSIVVNYAKTCLENNRSVIFITSNIKSLLNHVLEKFKVSGLKCCSVSGNPETVTKIINSLKKKAMILCILGNKTQINNVINIVNLANVRGQVKFNCIIDEVDDIIGSKSAKGLLVPELTKILSGSLSLTATPFAVLWSNNILHNNNLSCSQVIQVSGQKNHINIENTKYFKVHCDDYMFDPNNMMSALDIRYIKKCIKKGSEHKFYDLKQNKPQSDKVQLKIKGFLINIDRYVSGHENVSNALFKLYPDAYIILANGSNDKILKKHQTNGQIIETVSNGSLPSTLKFIHNKWTKDDYYLFVIGHKKVTRGTPLRSELDTIPDKCSDLLLITNHISKLSDTTTHDNNYQAMLRLQGIYPGIEDDDLNDLKLNLFTNQSSYDDILEYRKTISKHNEVFSELGEVSILEECPKVEDDFMRTKPFSAYKSKHHYYKGYPTIEAYNNRDPEEDQEQDQDLYKDIKLSMLQSKILNIIKNNNNKLTNEQIYKLDNTWKFDSDTPIANIARDTLYLYNNKYVKRTNNIPYEYYV
jgi:hypothetical protein